MKNILSIIGALLITATIWAQSPEKISYQAVLRDASQNIITNQSVGVQISILQGGESGTSIYVETQTPTTNTNGLITLEIGDGNIVEGTFSEIGWQEGPYFIKIETDPEGGSNYTITGVSQLLSVPFALHAKTAQTVENITIVGDEEVFANWDKDADDDFTGDYNDLDNLPVTITTEQAEAIDVNTLKIGNVQADWTAITGDSQILNKPINIDEDELDDVTLAGDQTITGTKTFTGVIAVPTPVNDTDAVTKAYVDSLETRLNVLELKFELSEGAVVSDLVDDGASAADLLAAGTSVEDLLAAGVSVSDLVDGGALVSDLIAAGSSVSDLVAEGVTADEFVGVYYEAEGGVIFYVDESDGSGLVCALSDYSEKVVWSDANLDVSTENGIGSGQANTLAIIAAQGDLTSSGENYAAQICNDLVLNSYDDWFLPSLDEVNLIVTNITKINETSLLEGGAVFTNNWMWTSSQYNIQRAYVKISYTANKEYYINFRTVRAF